MDKVIAMNDTSPASLNSYTNANQSLIEIITELIAIKRTAAVETQQELVEKRVELRKYQKILEKANTFSVVDTPEKAKRLQSSCNDQKSCDENNRLTKELNDEIAALESGATAAAGAPNARRRIVEILGELIPSIERSTPTTNEAKKTKTAWLLKH